MRGTSVNQNRAYLFTLVLLVGLILSPVGYSETGRGSFNAVDSATSQANSVGKAMSETVKSAGARMAIAGKWMGTAINNHQTLFSALTHNSGTPFGTALGEAVRVAARSATSEATKQAMVQKIAEGKGAPPVKIIRRYVNDMCGLMEHQDIGLSLHRYRNFVKSLNALYEHGGHAWRVALVFLYNDFHRHQLKDKDRSTGQTEQLAQAHKHVSRQGFAYLYYGMELTRDSRNFNPEEPLS